MWIDSDDVSVGDTRFLVETLDTSTGGISHSLRDSPLRTNQSHQPRLVGWCGETDNRSRTARGMVRVTKVVRPNDGFARACVRKLAKSELKDALAHAGYPELDQT